jgi:hypothetical protein
MGTGKKKCQECGLINSVSRVTCQTCGTRLYGTDKEDIGKTMHEHNKRLKNAVKTEDKKMEEKVKKMIERDVKKSDGAFKVAEDGTAEQIKSLKPEKTAKTPKKEKPARFCPCCGEPTNNGSYFKMGHDGRTHGLILKLDLGKIKTTEVKDKVLEMFEVWKKNKKASMREVAEKIT